MVSSFGGPEFCASGVGGVGIQSVTTILEDLRSPLNCAGEAIWTVFDILKSGGEAGASWIWDAWISKVPEPAGGICRDANNVTRSSALRPSIASMN